MIESIAALKNKAANSGEVIWIGIRPERKKPMLEVSKVEVVEGKGIVGDHFSGYTSGKRGLTLIQFEHLAVINSFLGRSGMIDPTLLRRNIVVRGLNIEILKDAVFFIGEVKMEGTGICAPCSRMEENIGFGGFNAVRGHGGITARINSSGTIKVGDKINLT